MTLPLGLGLGCGGDDGSVRDEQGIGSLDAGTSGDGDSAEASTSNSSGDGDGDNPTTTGDGDPSGDGDDDDDGNGGGGPKWDVKTVPDAAFNCGTGTEAEFSYIWIANSSQGTMTKLNTETMVEEGRYYMRPDGGGSPSRTSVSLSGDVAIAARSGGGGVSKFWANIDDCVESNGVPGIQTSTGANDILAWDMEECRAWHQPFVGKNYWSNRPMAWAPGKFNEGTCKYDDEKLWTSGSYNGGTEVLLLDGETGEIEQTIDLPIVGSSYLYGGAVDGDGNFWGLQHSSRIIRIDREDFSVQDWSLPGGPGYGIAVDSQNRVWTCGGGHASRFDPDTQQWQSTPGAGSGIGGCMTDGNGTLYHSRYSQGVIIAIDTDTVMPYKEYVIPSYVHGISVDFKGKVWGVTFASNSVYRLDPETEVVDTYAGLIGAYTYSDMTGFGLSSVANPSG
ncbi:MAG: hypothetical protein R6X02_32850 [Enhygromyxa sp.]